MFEIEPSNEEFIHINLVMISRRRNLSHFYSEPAMVKRECQNVYVVNFILDQNVRKMNHMSIELFHKFLGEGGGVMIARKTIPIAKTSMKCIHMM